MVESRGSIRVLLIEDDEDDYMLTREYFEDFEATGRHELRWESTYDEGLEALQQDHYDVCLLDYRLGSRDGVELLKQATYEGIDTPVIMLTGAGDRSVDRAAMRHGASDYLNKTEITGALLERAIDHAIERYRFSEKQRRLAAENRRLYRKAQTALEMRDEVHRIVAHDLRAPLSVMKLALQVMDRLVDAGEEVEMLSRHLDNQHNSIEKMETLIQDLLDTARIDDGAMSLTTTRCSPRSLMETTRADCQLRADAEGIELAVDGSEDVPDINIDKRRIEQVLTNLVHNALKFTPEGGRIEMSARAVGTSVRFSVTDTGCGIAEEQLSHLFDRFWQARQETAGGAGLGLAICKGIVEAHAGRIWAESTEGEGATFHFTIPVIDDKADKSRVG